MKPSKPSARVLPFPARAVTTPSTSKGPRPSGPSKARQLCEVAGFLASASVVLRARPDLPREALAAAGRSPANGARYTTPALVLARVEAITARAAV